MTDQAVIQLRPRQQPGLRPALLKKGEAASRLGVSERTLERWVRAGTVPHVYLGEQESILRFPAERLDAWWQRRCRGGS